MKTILITGGAGFIGSHLCKRLLNENNNIICIDNLFSGYMENIQDLINNKNFKFIQHDIINKIEIDESIDEIYHLACPASPKFYQKDPLFTLKTCFEGTYNICELAILKNARILFTSTSEIYGDPLIHPQKENYWGNVNTIGIRSCYDEGKRIGETILTEFHRNKQLNIQIARIFNTYGPNMSPSDGRVITNFVSQYIEQQDITIYGNGSQTRSLCFINDTVDGIIKLMNLCKYSGPVNIGNPIELTINEINEIIRKHFFFSKSKTIYLDLPQDDPKCRKPDISKAKELLNWEPKILFKDGLNSTIKFIKLKLQTKKLHM